MWKQRRRTTNNSLSVKRFFVQQNLGGDAISPQKAANDDKGRVFGAEMDDSGSVVGFHLAPLSGNCKKF